MANYPVKWYSNTMPGAPSLGDTTAGALTALLKAVLVTGFGTTAITTLVWDPDQELALATIAAGHTFERDSVIEVSGASPTAFNGEHRVKYVNSTQVWFELDSVPATSPATGTITMRMPPLGWVITHESADGRTFIIQPANRAAIGEVSLRVDNTAYTGWDANQQWLAKVQLVEAVTGLNTYTLIAERPWPATKRYSDGRWDIVGDAQLFYFLPAYGAYNHQALFMFGYIVPNNPTDRYHAALNHYFTATNVSRNWISGGYWPYTSGCRFGDTRGRLLARDYTQQGAAVTWSIAGMFGSFGGGLPYPNPVDMAFYLQVKAPMIFEAGGNFRGRQPGLVQPFFTNSGLVRKNYRDLPDLPDKILRLLLITNDDYTGGTPVMIGLDLTGPWR